MSPRRRTVLKAGSAIGLGGGGIIFWHRRSIRRRDDIDAIETALDIPVQTAENMIKTIRKSICNHEYEVYGIETPGSLVFEKCSGCGKNRTREA